jgi:hypothetical protein
MEDYSLGEHGAIEGPHGLAHSGADAAMVQCREPDGLDMQVDLCPLAGPVCADRILAADSPAFPPVRSVDVVGHHGQRGPMSRALNAR